MSDGQGSKNLPRLEEQHGVDGELLGYVVTVAAEREGYVGRVWIARDTRGRMVPVAAMVLPESLTVSIDPFDEIWAGRVDGLSSRDRLNVAAAMDHAREVERRKESAWASLDEDELKGLDPLLPPRPRGKGEPKPSDDELAHVSLVYLAALHTDPRRPVVEAQHIYARRGHDVDLDSIRHYVRMARLNRFLTASTAGRAGAEPDGALLTWYERWRLDAMLNRKGKKR